MLKSSNVETERRPRLALKQSTKVVVRRYIVTAEDVYGRNSTTYKMQTDSFVAAQRRVACCRSPFCTTGWHAKSTLFH